MRYHKLQIKDLPPAERYIVKPERRVTNLLRRRLEAIERKLYQNGWKIKWKIGF